MSSKLTSVTADQDTALAFATDVFGLSQKRNIPVGPGFRWLTVLILVPSVAELRPTR